MGKKSKIIREFHKQKNSKLESKPTIFGPRPISDANSCGIRKDKFGKRIVTFYYSWSDKSYNYLIRKLQKKFKPYKIIGTKIPEENKIQDKRKMTYTPEEGKMIVQYLDAGDKEGLIEWFNRRKIGEVGNADS